MFPTIKETFDFIGNILCIIRFLLIKKISATAEIGSLETNYVFNVSNLNIFILIVKVIRREILK